MVVGLSPMDTYVIATDGSPSARRAVAFGIDLADKQGAQVIFVHVAPASDWAPVATPVAPVRLPHEPNDGDRASLVEAVELARARGVTARTELLVGDRVDELVAFADAVDAKMIILGSRGHGPLASALLGSVSRGVLDEALRPVLIVRGEQIAA